MPWLDDDDRQHYGPPRLQGRDLFVSPKDAFAEGFRSESVWTAAADLMVAPGRPEFPPVEGYDPFTDPQTRGYENYLWLAARSKSPAETGYWMREADKISAKDQRLAEAGGLGVLGAIAGAVTNPDFLATGGLAALGRLTRTRGVLSAGAMGAAEETILQAADPGRTASESLWNVATIAAAGGLMGHLSARKGPATIDDLAARYAAGQDDLDARLAAGYQGSAWQRIDADGQSIGAAGAARRDDELLEGEGIADAFGIERIPDNPIKRLLQSPVLAARDAAARLTEIPFYQAKNAAGGASYVSVWQRYRARRAGLVDAMKATEDQWIAYRTRLGATKKTVLGQQASDLLRGRGQAMSFSEFREAVGWAKSDLDDIGSAARYEPEVIAAAQRWEASVYGPLGKEADELDLFSLALRRRKEKIEADLAKGTSANRLKELQDELTAIEARIERVRKGVHRPGFVNRLYRIDAIRARRGEFKSILRAHLGVTDDEAEGIVKRIIREHGYKPIDDDATGQAKSLHERTLRDIPDRALAGFLDRDISALGQHYHRTMGTDVELAREFNSEIDLRTARNAVREDYAAKIAKTSDQEKRAKLEKRMEADLKDLVALRDLVRGTFGLADDPTRFTSRAIRAAKYFNTLTQLTGAMAAVPDIGRLVMVEGLTRSFRDGLAPLFKNIGAYRLARRELALAGEGLDLYLSSRAAIHADMPDAFGTASRIERGLGRAAQLSFTVNLMNQWTDAIKGVTSMVTGTRILEDATTWAREGRNAVDIKRLARSGIDKQMSARIADQAEKFGEKFDHVWIANTDQWTDSIAAEAYRQALAKDVNIAIVTPAPGEKALWTSTEWGGLMTQFKSFGMSSTQRVLMAGLQERDMRFLTGSLMMIGLGALIDQVRAWQNGATQERDFATKLRAAVDRSGVLGWFMDMQGAGEDVLRGGPGGLLAGTPSGSNLSNIARVAGDWTALKRDDDTAKTVRRLLPLNRAWNADVLFDRVESAMRP